MSQNPPRLTPVRSHYHHHLNFDHLHLPSPIKSPLRTRFTLLRIVWSTVSVTGLLLLLYLCLLTHPPLRCSIVSPFLFSTSFTPPDHLQETITRYITAKRLETLLCMNYSLLDCCLSPICPNLLINLLLDHLPLSLWFVC